MAVKAVKGSAFISFFRVHDPGSMQKVCMA